MEERAVSSGPMARSLVRAVLVHAVSSTRISCMLFRSRCTSLRVSACSSELSARPSFTHALVLASLLLALHSLIDYHIYMAVSILFRLQKIQKGRAGCIEQCVSIGFLAKLLKDLYGMIGFCDGYNTY